MNRAMMLIAGLLLASSSALAFEGTYRGSYEFLGGDYAFCMEEPRATMAVTVQGTSARVIVLSGVRRLRLLYRDGAIASDGSFKMRWAPNNEYYDTREITFEGSVIGDTLTAVWESNRCRVKWTLTKNFFW